MSNPLIAQDEGYSNFTNFSTEDNAFLEGAGIFSDAANTLTDLGSGNWGSLALDAVGDGLSALSLITDPFGTLASAPIGWIIEHIGFLKEVLDKVAGDPEAIKARSQTWTNIAAALDKSAADYEASSRALADKFSGAAASAYTKAAANYTTAVKGASGHAKQASKAFETAGAIVGTVRGVIRDLFATFAAHALERGLVALASSEFTFGASIAAWTLDTVAEGIAYGERAAAKIVKAVREVMELANGASRSTRALEAAERDLLAGAGKRATALRKFEDAKSETRAANSKAGAAENRIKAAQDAQARARQHIDEATSPAQREAAENELRNAQAREANQRGNLDQAHRDQETATDHRLAAREEHDAASKHELPKKVAHARDAFDYGVNKPVNAGKDAYDDVTDDEPNQKADKTAGGLDDGSLVE